MGNCSGLRRPSVGKAIWLAGAVLCVGAPATAVAGTLTFQERVQAQGALDRVAYAHRLWPQATSRPKPSFEALFPEDVRRRKVEEYLAKSAVLADYWQRPLAAEQLQAEIDRMVRSSKAPDVLGEMFAALGHDPRLIAECLARPILADRLARQWYAHDPRFQGEGKFEDWLHDRVGVAGTAGIEDTVTHPFRLPRLAPTVGADNTWTPMTQMPAERAGHTLVWTGTEMIVWGGTVGNPVYYPFNSGGRYNPATDTWSLTSTVNAPAARTLHSGVWTGTEMIVWGGTGSYPLASGGRYNPSTDTWTATALPPATIKARKLHSTVWTGTEMIVWGGSGASGVGTTGGRYNPATDTWTATSASGLSARYGHRAVWTGAEMIVWGGHDYGTGFLNDGRRYNPATNTWAAVAMTTLLPPRYLHSAVWTGTEMVVWGGVGTIEYQNGARYDPSTDTWAATSLAGAPAANWNHPAVWTGALMLVPGGRYDPSTDTWTSMSAAGAHSSPAAVWTGSEMIVWGGGWGSSWVPSGLGARYNPTSDSWVPTATSDAPTPRMEHTAVWTGTEMVVWGGLSNAYEDSGGRYSPATDAWTPTSLSGTPSARTRHVAVWTGSTMIVWGGCASADSSGCPNTGARYDPVADGWTPLSLANAPAGRDYLTAVWTGAEMIVWGGYDGGTYPNTGGRYNPVSDTWAPTSVANAPVGRLGYTAVWTGAEMIVWGGSNINYVGVFDTGGRYDPVADTWTATSLVGAPDGRRDFTSVWSGTEMIVWGGWGMSFPLSPLGSRYDPAADTWTPISRLGAPADRYDHVAVWTGAEMIVWAGRHMELYEPVNSGGRYDPSSDSWSATTTVDAPSPRELLPAVWTGAEMLVWSGGGTYTGGRYVPGLVLTPGALPDGVQGVAYGRPLSASGGTGPYTFAVTAGSLPTGLTLSSAGLLSGIPDAAGAYSFTVTATDATSRTGSRAYSLTITPSATADLSITVSDGGVTPLWGGPLSYSLTVTNSGPGAVTGATVSDSFPAGLASVAWTCTASLGSACTAAGSGNLSDAAVALLPGGTATYSAIGVVVYGTAGPLANTATVGSSAYDPVPANNSSTVSTPVDGDLIFKDGFQGP